MSPKLRRKPDKTIRCVAAVVSGLLMLLSGTRQGIADAPVPMREPIYAGALTGLDQCGPGRMVLSSDKEVFELSNAGGHWKRLPGAIGSEVGGVLCSDDGQMLLITTERAKRIYRRRGVSWDVVQTSSLADKRVFAGPNFLMSIPTLIEYRTPSVQASMLLEQGEASKFEQVTINLNDIFDFANRNGHVVSEIEVDNPIESGVPAGILLRNLRPFSKNSAAAVFDFGDPSERYIAWANNGFEHWEIHLAPPVMYESTLHRGSDASITIGANTLEYSAMPFVKVFDCSTARNLACAERLWNSDGKELSPVLVGESDYFVAYDRGRDCFQLVRESTAIAACRTLPPGTAYPTPVELISSKSMVVVMFVVAGENQPVGLRARLFDFTP